MKNNEYMMLSGLDLVMMEFPEERFIVQDVVPKGLVILNSDVMEPARSLAMDMSLRVIKGDRLWKMDTKQGAVLYMIHHHTLATARNLIMEMTVRIPDELYVGVMTENSLELALTGVKSFVKDRSNVSLVVIEMSGMVDQYEDAVYVSGDTIQQYIALRELAMEHGIAIVVILCSDSIPVVQGKKTDDEDMVCITDKTDGHIDMCILDAEDREAILRVDIPPMTPRLWSIELDEKSHRWVEENTNDRP